MTMNKPYLHAKPAHTRKSLTNMKKFHYKQNPNLHEKPYLHANLAPTRKTLTYMKTLEYKEIPNLHEQILPTCETRTHTKNPNLH